ncbi:MAG: 50S ribosomal protein L21 [Planctomycetes bacterium]|nr:50S ribosomal protein L21 [Planctomycetota bacterium]MCB9890724.1 50S ribosomal protein L21 [Planctomycetota bacterium]MCB9920053.1 50S ribosomal protein L21 [Planctomycetota bacterium]
MYAIAEDRNQQLTCRPGETVLLDYNGAWNQGAEVVLDKVCLVGPVGDEGGSIQVGTPYVSGASVALEVLGHEKAAKIVVGKYRKRKNYRRKQGHRQQFTRARVKDIRI